MPSPSPTRPKIELKDDFQKKKEKDVNKDAETIAEEGRRHLPASAQQTCKSIAQDTQLKKTIQKVEQEVQTEIEMERIVVPDEPSTSGQQFTQSTTIERSERTLRDASQSMGRHRTLRNYVAKHWLGFLGFSGLITLTMSATTLVLTLIKTYHQPDSEDFGLTDEQKERIKTLVKDWINKPEDQFWDLMATYADKWNPSVEAQILFMRYTKSMYGSHEWNWDGTLTKGIDELVSIFGETKTYSSIYKEVKKYISTDPNIPGPLRDALATMCEFALGIIRENLLLQSNEIRGKNILLNENKE